GLLTASANIASVADLGVQSLPARTNQLTDSLDLSPAPSVEGVPPAAPEILDAAASANPPNTPAAPRQLGTVALTPVAAFPDNINGTNTINGRYFDVTLRNAGIVTLGGISPTIDRLTVNGAGAGLTINAGSTLTSLISPELWLGNITANGNLKSALNIWQLGGTIQGTGALQLGTGGGFFSLGGKVAPGNSIGTLSVSGNYFLGDTGLLEIELTNGASDLLAVSGNATLAGTVQFKAFGPNPLEGQSYTFLTTGGTVTGRFSAVQDLLPGALFPIVSYGANFAKVTVSSLCSFASGPVQTPTCGALNDPAVQSDPDMTAALAQLQQLAATNPTALSGALEALNPTRAHAQTIVGFSAGDLLRNQFGRRTHDLFGGASGTGMASLDVVGAQLASSDPSAEMLASAAAAALAGAGAASDIKLPNGNGIFFAADVAITDTDQVAAIGKDTADVAALTVGLDHSDGAGFVLGAALSYLQSNVSQDYGLGGDTSGEGVAISGYGNLNRDRFYIDAFLSYAWQDFETSRRLLVGPFVFADAKGSTDASQTQAGATLGYALSKSENASFHAVGGLYYMNLDIGGYTETGAGALSAVIPSRSIDSLKGQIGGELAVHLQPGNDTLVPLLRLVWNHEFMDDPLLIQSGFAGAPATTFATPGPNLGSDWATVGVGVSGKVSAGTSFYIRYQHDFGRDGQQNEEVSAAARMAF
ncbi:MAG: autotransporter outer membrane beta-barrel domain-containing protein, partial [Alphaproteobacteria bacterium]|nr:autotransporter outer membrane beta-barrel domain-containing protein [Alphaproteobacteria bacterium]